MEKVVDKFFSDGAQGILIIPLWYRKAWFHALQTIAISWWDIPPEVDIFEPPLVFYFRNVQIGVCAHFLLMPSTCIVLITILFLDIIFN